MSEQRFGAEVDGLGRLRPDSPEAYAALLQALKGKRVVVTIKRERNTRTAEQNRLLWSVYGEAVAEGVDLIELATGQPVFQCAEDVHAWAKLNFLRRPVETNHGTLNLLGTTTTLSTEEFSRYVELVCGTLAKLGVYIPPTR